MDITNGVFSMLISNINQQSSFKANLPVYKVFTTLKNGITRELAPYETKGPVQALVVRLNKKNSVSDFFQKIIPDFQDIRQAESTITGKNYYMQRHIIFGDDAIRKRNLEIECYKNQNISKEEVRDYIKNSLLAPLQKKVRLPRYKGDNIGEQVGLVLHTKEVSKGYNKLQKIQVTTIDGRVFTEIEVK